MSKRNDTKTPREVHRDVVRALHGAEIAVALAVLEEVRLLVAAAVLEGHLTDLPAPLVVRDAQVW